MKKFAFALVALLMSIGVTYAQTLDEATAKYTSAVEKVKAQDFAAAIPLLKEAMNKSIDAGDEGAELTKEVQKLLPMVYLQLGVTQFKEKKFDEAIQSLTTAEEMADLYNNVNIRRQASRVISGIYMSQGIELFNTKDYAGALEIFKKGYAQDNSNIKLASFTAKAYAELGQLDQAVPLFNDVIEKGSTNSRYAQDAEQAKIDLDNYVLVGVSSAAEAKDIDKAIALADLVPADPKASLLVIQAANNAKKFDVVIARGDKTAELQSDAALKGDVNYFIGMAYNGKENKAKAIEYLMKVTAGQYAGTAKAAVAELKK
ncbi:MAG: tetratricopeptide repeat protein [Mucinivorans sp.]